MDSSIFAWIGPIYLLAVAWPLTRIDLRERRLPNRLVVPAFPIILLGQLSAAFSGGHWLSLGIALACGLCALVIGLLVNRFANLGMGDVKLIAAITLALAWFNPLSPFIALLLGFAVATVVVVAMLIRRKIKMGSTVALGPYLLVGFVLALAGQF
jgi:leader peptidase (prepilin peptidase)/N-methyltransferase